ncbi:MAG TPA: hypothetical protein ENH82_09890 [bacterium]|nr:hypothetical protein [bacterium]
MAKKIKLYVGINLLQHVPFEYEGKVVTLNLIGTQLGMIGAFPVFRTKKEAKKALGKKGEVVAVSVTLNK